MQERRLKYVILFFKSNALAPSKAPPPPTKKDMKRSNFISFKPTLPQLFLYGSVDASKLQNLYNGLMIH